jgi:hypothetical protein
MISSPTCLTKLFTVVNNIQGSDFHSLTGLTDQRAKIGNKIKKLNWPPWPSLWF